MWSREDRRTLVLLLPLLVLAVAAFLLLEPKTPRSGAPPDAAKEAPPELFLSLIHISEPTRPY